MSFNLNTDRLLLYLFHALKKKENDPSVLVSELTNGIAIEVSGIHDVLRIVDSLGRIGAHYELSSYYDDVIENEDLEKRVPDGASINIFSYDQKLFANFDPLVNTLVKQKQRRS